MQVSPIKHALLRYQELVLNKSRLDIRNIPPPAPPKPHEEERNIMENTGDTKGGHGAAVRAQLPGLHSCLSPWGHGRATLRDLCLLLEGWKHLGAVPPSPQGHLSPKNITWVRPEPRIEGHSPRGEKPRLSLTKGNGQIVPQRRQGDGLQLPGIAQSQNWLLVPPRPTGKGGRDPAGP